MFYFLLISLLYSITFVHGSSSKSWSTLDGSPPTLFGHQGDKALFPEHSLASYWTAGVLGAEWVEPDLVMTKDGHIICYHDITLGRGTNIRDFPEFSGKMKNFTGEVSGIKYNIINEWFVEDFSLEDIKLLSVHQQNVGVRPQYFNGLWPIATFAEFLDEMQSLNEKLGRTVGIIPEIKHPKFHNRNVSESTPYFMEDSIVQFLQDRGYNLIPSNDPNRQVPTQAVILQCFDGDSLAHLSRTVLGGVQLMMLVHPELNWLTFKGIQEISTFATHVSLFKEYLYTGVEAEIAYKNWTYNQEEIDSMGGFVPANEFVLEAHKNGLKMVVWTINDSREDGGFGCAIKCEDPQDKTKEMVHFLNQGVDGIFVENMAESREILAEYLFQLEMAKI